MKPFEIFIAYVAWQGGGKSRPILVISSDSKVVRAFRITSKYDSKSTQIQNQYFEIKDWQTAGLVQKSYIDTICPANLPVKYIIGNTPIGKLSENDKQRLIQFLSK